MSPSNEPQSSSVDTLETGWINFWGNIEWQVKLSFTTDLEIIKISFWNKGLELETIDEATSLYELAQIIKSFAKDHGITIFTRRIVSFLFDLLTSAGMKIKEEEIQEQVQKSLQEGALIGLSGDRRDDFHFGPIVPFGGTFRWKIQIGITGGIDDSIYLRFLDLKDQRPSGFEVKDLKYAIQLIKDKIVFDDLLFDRRLARWLSDYFEVYLRIPLSYTSAMNIIKEREDVETEVMDGISDEEVLQLIPTQNKEVKSRTKKIQLIEMENMDNLLDLLDSVLENNKEEENTIITRTGKFVTENGKEIEIESQNLETQPGTEFDQRILSSKFQNTLEETIKNFELSDLLPYDLKLEEVKTSIPMDIQKELTDAGMQLTFKIDEVLPKQNIEINYISSRRISRSIILHSKNEVDVINTNFQINRNDPSVLYLYSGNTEFVDLQEKEIETIIIKDFIPNDFGIRQAVANESIRPDFLGLEDGTEVKWIHKSVKSGDVFRYHFTLIPKPFVTLYRGSVQKSSDEALFNFAVLSQPITGTTNFILSVIAESQQLDKFEAQFEMQLPSGATITKFIIPENQKTDFFWDVIPPLYSKHQILSINASFSHYQRITLSFAVNSPVIPFDFLTPLAIKIDDYKIVNHFPNFASRQQSFLPIPQEHTKLYNSF